MYRKGGQSEGFSKESESIDKWIKDEKRHRKNKAFYVLLSALSSLRQVVLSDLQTASVRRRKTNQYYESCCCCDGACPKEDNS